MILSDKNETSKYTNDTFYFIKKIFMGNLTKIKIKIYIYRRDHMF